MAVVLSNDQSTYFCENSYWNHISLCNFWEDYKHRLEKLTQELLSPKKIIQLLQEEVNTGRVPNATTTDSQHTASQLINKSNLQVSNKTYIWETVPNRSRSTGKPFGTTYPTPIPVVRISNHFSVLYNTQYSLYNYQSDWKSTRCVVQQPPTSHHNRGVTLTRKKENKCKQAKQQKKIIVIGDSHSCGLACELKNYLGHEYSISGTIISGTCLNNVTQLAKNELAALSRRDTITVWGWSNYVNKNETQSGFKCLYNFINQRTNTNLLTLTIPHRHDLSLHSCVNKEILTFNWKLHKVMKNIERVKVVEYDLTRDYFTCHGLHINASGRTKVAKAITQILTQPSEQNVIKPINMQWKDSTSDPTPLGSTTEALNEETEHQNNKQEEEEEEKLSSLTSLQQKSSNRRKKTPLTRS